MDDYKTVSQIAETLNQPRHRIKYVIMSRGIKPEHRYGSTAVYSFQTAQFIADEILRMDSMKVVVK